MDIGGMFGQSAVLTMLGMGVVFGFLIIMIICITLSGRIIHALGLDKEPVPAAAGGASAAAASGDAGVVAAISAAVTVFRNRK